MSRRKIATVAGLIALLFIGALVWAPGNGNLPRGERPQPPSGNPEPTISPSSAKILPSEPPATFADKFNSPSSDIRTDLKIVAEMIDTFRSNFPQTGNPVGDNREITAALRGKNKLHLALIPLDHPAVNLVGELCDRWGTPFFFHAESATRMEIRSAGPDKKLFTADDVVQSP